MPVFSLKDYNGVLVNSADITAKVLVVAFWCNHCPFVQHVADGFVALTDEFDDSEVGFVAINSNSPDRVEEDGAEGMRKEAQKRGYKFPYLVDATQDIARAFQAVCTPDFYVFDESRILRYHGRLDSSRPTNGVPVTGDELRGAIVAVIDQKHDVGPGLPSIGCSIKWIKSD